MNKKRLDEQKVLMNKKMTKNPNKPWKTNEINEKKTKKHERWTKTWCIPYVQRKKNEKKTGAGLMKLLTPHCILRRYKEIPPLKFHHLADARWWPDG